MVSAVDPTTNRQLDQPVPEPSAPEAVLEASLAAACGRLAARARSMALAAGAALVLLPDVQAEAVVAIAGVPPNTEAGLDWAALTRGQDPRQGEGAGLVGWPVQLAGGAQGALWLWYPADEGPRPAADWLPLLAGETVSRAHAAYLVADRAERVARLNRLIATIKNIARSLELSEILPEIIKDASQLLNAGSGDILLFDQERRVLRVAAVYSFPQDMLNFEMPLGAGISSQAMASGRPVMVPDYMAYPWRVTALDPYQFKAVLSVPLMSRGAAIGALNVHSEEVGYRYSEDDINLLAAFADHAAVAIDNAQRYVSEKRMVADLRELNERLAQSMAIQQQFTQQALHGGGLAGLARRLAAIIDRPVVIEDPFFRVLASAAPSGTACPELATPPWLQRQGLRQPEPAHLAAAQRPATVPGCPERLVAPLTAADDGLGYLTVVAGDVPLGPVAEAAIELAAINCTLELLKQRAAVEVEARLRGDFVLDLVSGNFRDPESLMARAAFLGHNLNGPFELVVVEIDDLAEVARRRTEREAVRMRQQVFESARRFLAHKAPQNLTATQSDSLIILAGGTPASQDGRGQPQALALAQALKRELRATLPEVTLSAAAGEACSAPADFRRAYEAARNALDLMKSLGRRDQLIDTQALGFYGLLLQSNSRDRLAAYARQRLQALRDYDARHHTALLPTLQLYYKHGAQKQAAAQAAFLHVNTLTYRLRKIQDVLGVDLHQPDDVLQIQFALKVLETLPVWPD